VFEGAETEYRYFQSMRQALRLSALHLEFEAKAGQALQLVRNTIRLRNERQRRARKGEDIAFDEVWCVFDREAANEPHGFGEAVQLADTETLLLAISNPAFEYWYILHFRETNRSFQHAQELKDALRTHIPGYRENMDVFEQIQSMTAIAIERAERCIEQHPDYPHDRFPNPSTLVYRLVRSIREHE
jgi:hypothetical protein